MTTPNFPVLDLATLSSRVAGRVKLGETVHDVLKFTGRQYEALGKLTPQDRTITLYDLAHQVVPTATPDDIASLTSDEINAILAMARNGIEAVEALFPKNAAGPAGS